MSYTVEYTNEGNEVCIIPMPSIPFDDFKALSDLYIEQGYQYWLPADHRRGYRFSKVIPAERQETVEEKKDIIWRD